MGTQSWGWTASRPHTAHHQARNGSHKAFACRWKSGSSHIYPGLTFDFSSLAQLCLALCDPMDWSTPGFPVHHQLPELAQTHVGWVGDAIQPPHPLLSPFPPAFNLSQHQSLFQWVSSSHLACEHCPRCNQHYHQPEATSPEALLLWCFCLFSEVFLQQWGMFSVICGTMSIYIFIYILDWMK